MNLSQANSREHQQQVIDAEIKSLEESIRVLRRRRNALAPISSLPPEVIAAIFSFSRASSSDFIPGEKPDPLAWLRVSHVCHQWRDTALNQPLFWNHVDFTTLSSAGAAEILTRAKTAPLYLEARVSGGHWDYFRLNAFQEELQRRIPRICHLLISANIRHLRDTLSILVSPADSLERLSLSNGEDGIKLTLPETLFGGTTPRLSCLVLRDCNISWTSPLLKGLRCLDIRLPSANATPSLSASPIANLLPLEVKRTITLPSLTHMNISDSPRDCALALAHLDLPALTWLRLKTFSCLSSEDDVQEVLPYLGRHAHGPQDTQPLQSVLIRGKRSRAEILAWSVPDIDVAVRRDPPTLRAARPLARVALSFAIKDPNRYETHIDFLGMVVAALPLNGLLTLITQDHLSPPFDRFWLHDSPKWPLLRRVRLTSIVAERFIDWLLADEEGRENPLLPSLKELVLVDSYFYENWTLRLCDVLMKRVEQGASLEMLDLRTCCLDPDNPGAVRLLSEIVVDVLGPETPDARAQVISMLDHLSHGPFAGHFNSGEETQFDDDEYESNTSGNDEDEGDQGEGDDE
ncbi:hypothetical protein EI94DRAFT_1757046 [Lactarius quietus]|nr:hypothetical protein EI94DRAFT_1757046 [Lactarius quietus]